MIKNNILKALFPFLLIVAAVLDIHAQTEYSGPVMKANAAKYYQQGMYADALELYEILLKRYPKDYEYNYYTGTCLLMLNQNLDKAAELLNFATTRPNVSSDAFYFLGRIYMLNYQFNEAKNAFEKFLNLASKQEKRSLDGEGQLQHAWSALELTKQYIPYETVASSLFSFSDKENIRQIRSTGGELKPKPAALLTAGEKQGEPASYYFLPDNINRGDYIYISGYGKNKKNGLELFRVKYIDGLKWGPMEALTSLNTSSDEILPYFDPSGPDLYFASTGYNSMGGFDIFKSHYDEKKNIWSVPINIGFPFNSPFDDFLHLSETGPGTILLVTQRGGYEGFNAAYRLNISDSKQDIDQNDPEELKIIAGLGHEKSESFPEIPELFTDYIKNTKPADEPMIKKSEIIILSDEEKLPKEEGNSYNSALKEALTWQFKADSLANLSRDTRIKARETFSATIKENLLKNVEEWEKKSAEYQLKADEQYKVVKEIETRKRNEKTHLSGSKSDFSSKKTLQEDPGVAEFQKPEEKLKSTDTANLTVESREKGAIEKKINNSQKSGFVILDRSPYSDSNPFPMNLPFPAGAFYSVQLAVYSHKIKHDTFGGFSPVYAETIPGKNLIRYYAGRFNNYEEAAWALETIKKAGYSDAFLVAWYNGQKMPPAKVHEYEKRK